MQGVPTPNKHGNSVTNSITSLLWIRIVIPNFKRHNIIMSTKVYFMKTVNGCKYVSLMSPQDEQRRRRFTLFVCCNFLVLLRTTVCSQNINKQNVNTADETLTNYSFLSRYHHTKSKNYLKRRYRIRHWIPMFFGTPCISGTTLWPRILIAFQLQELGLKLVRFQSYVQSTLVGRVRIICNYVYSPFKIKIKGYYQRATKKSI